MQQGHAAPDLKTVGHEGAKAAAPIAVGGDAVGDGAVGGDAVGGGAVVPVCAGAVALRRCLQSYCHLVVSHMPWLWRYCWCWACRVVVGGRGGAGDLGYVVAGGSVVGGRLQMGCGELKGVLRHSQGGWLAAALMVLMTVLDSA